MKDFTYYRRARYNFIRRTVRCNWLRTIIPLLLIAWLIVRTNEQWIGAVYYNIIQKTFNKNYYTLLGYDENDTQYQKMDKYSALILKTGLIRRKVFQLYE